MRSKPLRILIDGYNVLFQSQLVGRGRQPGWLERARGRLLKLLGNGLSEQELLHTEIVFDASKEGKTPDDEVLSSGLVVTFARTHPEADDLIEERIRKHAHPKSLRVVSADNRILKCARSRKAILSDPESFLQAIELAAASKGSSHEPQILGEDLPEKPSGRTPVINEDEVDFWLAEFDLEHPDSGNESGT